MSHFFEDPIAAFEGEDQYEAVCRDERTRVIRLVREALAVKPGPYPDRRKVQAVERVLKELE